MPSSSRSSSTSPTTDPVGPSFPGPRRPPLRALMGNGAAQDFLRRGGRLQGGPGWRDAAAALAVVDPGATGSTTTGGTATGSATSGSTTTTAPTTDGPTTTTAPTTDGPTTTTAPTTDGPTTTTAPTTDGPTAPAVDPHRPAVTSTLRDMYDQNERLAPGARRQNVVGERDYAAEIERFKAHWEKNKETYEALAKEHDVPAALIAALHYREGDMSFDRYLAQGDPVGKKPTNAPVHPAFDTWKEGADWALDAKTGNRDALAIHADTRDAGALATYAEAYNGGGYHNRGLSNPYVWAGTDNYTGGKWTRDGAKGYDPNTNDAQVGVMALLDAVGAVDGMALDEKKAPTPTQAWWKQVYSGKGIPEGTSGPQVTALQEKLIAAGHLTGAPSGTYDAATKAAVKAWQKAAGIGADGDFGPTSLRTMEKPRLWTELESGDIQVKSGGGGLHGYVAQEKLAELGYLSGSADGNFGDRSAAALEKFQKSQKLDTTGVLDAATASALHEADS